MVDPVLLIIYVTTNNHGWCQQQKEIYILWICFQQGLLMIADWEPFIFVIVIWNYMELKFFLTKIMNEPLFPPKKKYVGLEHFV